MIDTTKLLLRARGVDSERSHLTCQQWRRLVGHSKAVFLPSCVPCQILRSFHDFQRWCNHISLSITQKWNPEISSHCYQSKKYVHVCFSSSGLSPPVTTLIIHDWEYFVLPFVAHKELLQFAVSSCSWSCCFWKTERIYLLEFETWYVWLTFNSARRLKVLGKENFPHSADSSEAPGQ